MKKIDESFFKELENYFSKGKTPKLDLNNTSTLKKNLEELINMLGRHDNDNNENKTFISLLTNISYIITKRGTTC